jgi:hypothetical protein
VREDPVAQRERARPHHDEERRLANRRRLERFLDQLEGHRADEDARSQRHDDRDHGATRREQIRDQRADEQRRGSQGTPQERFDHPVRLDERR